MNMYGEFSWGIFIFQIMLFLFALYALYQLYKIERDKRRERKALEGDTEAGYDQFSRDMKKVMDHLSDRFGRPATPDEALIFIYGDRADRKRIWKERGARLGERYEFEGRDDS